MLTAPCGLVVYIVKAKNIVNQFTKNWMGANVHDITIV